MKTGKPSLKEVLIKLLLIEFLFFVSHFEGISDAAPVKTRLSVNIKLEPYILGKKRIEFTREQAQLKTICLRHGYEDCESFGKDELSGLYYAICRGDSDRVLAFENRKVSRAERTPISELERELQGKLFFVQTLPGLSEDGTLIATYNPKGIHIGERNGDLEIQGDHLDTLHFSVNSLVQFNGGFGGERYIEHPYVVIIPFQEQGLLDAVTSFSFTEAVTLGDYKLPQNAIILFRGSSQSKEILSQFGGGGDSQVLEAQLKAELDKLDSQERERMQKTLAFYEERGFRVIPFYDSVPRAEQSEKTFFRKGAGDELWREIRETVITLKNERDPQKKYDAVKKVILEEGGFDSRLVSKNYWVTEVPGPEGRNINTPELAKKLFPGKAVSYGLDDYTQLNSPGEQWRSMSIRGNGRRIPDIGFSIEEHHSEKFNRWLSSLNPPRASLEQHLRVNKENRIAFRANDLIFGHFRNKEKARAYIRDHLSSRNGSAEYRQQFEEKVKSGASVENLAKDYCDFEALSGIQETGPFDLATKEELLQNLWAQTQGMHPQEASLFFKEYFKKSAILNAPEFSAEVKDEIRNLARNYYAVLYYNHLHRPTELSHEEERLLFNMMNLKQGLYPQQAYAGLILALTGESLSELGSLSKEELGKRLQGKFEKTFSELYRKVRTRSASWMQNRRF